MPKKFPLLALAALMFFIAPHTARAETQLKETVEAPQIIVAKFYADWCGSCKIMQPALETFLDATADEPVLYVHFDLTDETTRQKSAYLAHTLGLSEIYKDHAAKTGYALLVDAQTRAVHGRLGKEMDKDAMLVALNEAQKSD